MVVWGLWIVLLNYDSRLWRCSLGVVRVGWWVLVLWMCLKTWVQNLMKPLREYFILPSPYPNWDINGAHLLPLCLWGFLLEWKVAMLVVGLWWVAGWASLKWIWWCGDLYLSFLLFKMKVDRIEWPLSRRRVGSLNGVLEWKQRQVTRIWVIHGLLTFSLTKRSHELYKSH